MRRVAGNKALGDGVANHQQLVTGGNRLDHVAVAHHVAQVAAREAGQPHTHVMMAAHTGQTLEVALGRLVGVVERELHARHAVAVLLGKHTGQVAPVNVTREAVKGSVWRKSALGGLVEHLARATRERLHACLEHNGGGVCLKLHGDARRACCHGAIEARVPGAAASNGLELALSETPGMYPAVPLRLCPHGAVEQSLCGNAHEQVCHVLLVHEFTDAHRTSPLCDSATLCALRLLFAGSCGNGPSGEKPTPERGFRTQSRR